MDGKENLFIFGSELKAFLEHPDSFKKEINKDSIFSLLRYYNVSGPNTIFKDIFKLRPGTVLSINQKMNVKKRFFGLLMICYQIIMMTWKISQIKLF